MTPQLPRDVDTAPSTEPASGPQQGMANTPAHGLQRRQPYQPPRVEALGHWQVHTMETFSVPIQG